MKRIIGIDLGEVRTGLAVSDPLGMMASGIGTISAYTDEKLLSQLEAEIKKQDARLVVMGNPINMNGTVGERSERIKYVAGLLRERTGLEVVLIDERMTTMEASRYMNVTDTRGKKRKARIDTLSAEIILQTYLDRERNKRIK